MKNLLKLARALLGRTDVERDRDIQASDERITRNFTEAHQLLSAPGTPQEEIDAASVRLNAISARCLRNPMRPACWLLVLVPVLALAGGGCSSKKLVLEEDLHLLDLTKQIVERQAGEIVKLEDALADAGNQISPFVLGKLLPIQGNLKHLNEQAAGNVAVFVSNWGAPGVAQLYSDEVNAKAREAAKTAHSVTFWGSIGTGVVGTALFIIGLARSPVARLIPGIGQMISACDPLLAGAEKFMATMKAKGCPEVAEELAAHLISEQQTAGVDRFVTKRLDKIKVRIAPALDAIADMTKSLTPDAGTPVG